MESPYDVLPVAPDADEEAIKRAYRRRVLEVHPDQGGSVREFQRVQAAYEEITSRRRDGVADADAEDAPEETTDWEGDPRSQVEYLNYEVLDDRGWAIDDEGLFEKAADAGLDQTDYGRFSVEPGESILAAAEEQGFTWPYACRGGACANCAIAVVEGELSMPVDHILTEELMDRGIRLSCNGIPITDELKVVFNVKHLPTLEDLRLPPTRFERAQCDD